MLQLASDDRQVAFGLVLDALNPSKLRENVFVACYEEDACRCLQQSSI